MSDTVIAAEEARRRLVRRDDYVSCSLAFIDCKKPGSHLKQNYSIIGPGVTTSKDQIVNLGEAHGFSLGAAAMPSGIVNNLHIHYTAEVFYVARGEWEFRWGPGGEEGQVVAREGDVVSLPTWIFRGFKNVGPDDGWIFTFLGGDDTGGIIWDPEIIREAAGFGLYLTKGGVLVDTERGDAKPDDAELIEPISREDIAKLRRYSVEDMRRRLVTKVERAWSADALLDSCLEGHASEMAPVLGYGMAQDRDLQPKVTNPHGFSLEWLRVQPGSRVGPFRLAQKQVVIAQAGSFELELNTGAEAVRLELGPMETYSFPAGVWRTIRNLGDTAGELMVATAGDERKRPEWAPEIVEAARAAGRGLDHNGYVAPAALLPQASALFSRA